MSSLIANYFMKQALGELVFTLLVIDILASIVIFALLRRSQKSASETKSFGLS